jgi:vancomycin resistance protein YoaR
MTIINPVRERETSYENAKTSEGNPNIVRQYETSYGDHMGTRDIVREYETSYENTRHRTGMRHLI